MQAQTRHIFRSGALLVAVLLLVGAFASAAIASPGRSPAHAPAAALPATPCTGSGTVTCELWATTGTLTLPGSVTVPIWGYSTSSTAGTATLPGPALIVDQGNTVNVIVHNNLPAAAGSTSLLLPGQSLAPDATGAAGGGSATYIFTAANPGTYLYEAGLTANGPVQSAMGLFGGLVVRSSTAGTAYGSPASAFSDESLLVLSEVDPALNNSVNPTTFNLHDYAPKYWLINGEAYPDTDAPSPMITAAPGANLLLRYVNAGLEHHSMSLAGLHQAALANDGKPYQYPYTVTAETIPAGATLDTLATIPAAALAGTRFALYEAANHLDNNGTLNTTPASPLSARQIVFGGMLTFVTVAGVAAPAGPATNNVALSPNPTNGAVNVTLSASIGTAGDPSISAAEYFVDATGTSGTGCPITTGLGAAPASVSRIIPTTGGVAPCVDLTTLPTGNHTFYVHGQNVNGWGGFGSAVLNLDKLGPTTSLLALNPNPTNGTVNVALDATGSDVGRGNSNVDAIEYFIDAACASGGGTAMIQNTPVLPTLSTTPHFVATILAATVNALAQGDHIISVNSHDVLGNWGPCATITLHVDKTAPNTTGALATPNPTNGAIGVLIGDFLQEKLSATASDPVAGGINSNLKAAEAFIDTITANGTGIVALANDAVFNSTTEGVYAAIPLFAMGSLSQGRHTIYIHGQDVAGNWGTFSTTTMDVDRTGPNVTSASALPNPTLGATSVTLSGSATDPVTGGTPAAAPASNIVAAEWFDGADPGAGLGNAMTGTFGSTTVSNLSATITVSGLSLGTHNISVRAKDVAGNWGPVTVVLLNVTPADSIFADGFEIGNFSAWSATGGTVAQISVTGAGAMVGTRAMQAVISGGASGFVQNNSPVTTATGYRARFYFNPNNTTTATGQQHDIFVALNTSNLTVFRIQYRRSSSSGNAAQVRAVVSRSNGGGTPVVGAWFTINTNTANVIEVSWLAGTSTTFTLFTNGTAHTLTGLNTNSTTFRIDAVRLGPQVGPAPVTGTTPGGTTLAGASGTEYFDAFVSRRNNTLIGP